MIHEFDVTCVDISELEEARKASEAAAAQQLLQQQNQQPGTNQSTPDYAVGLTAMNPPTPAPATPSYSPATPQHTLTTIIAIPRDVTGNKVWQSTTLAHCLSQFISLLRNVCSGSFHTFQYDSCCIYV